MQHASLWLIACLGVPILYQAYSDYVFEDAYITYRYARNVAAGIGYAFNSGEHVFGATSPLHTLTLALCGFLGANIPTCAGVISAVGLSAVGLIGGYILRHFKSPNAAMLFALLAISSTTRPYLSWGIETSMLASILLGSLLATLKKRNILAGVLAGLAFLTRYDAGLFAILLFTLMLLRDRKIPWKPGLVASGIVLPWLLFAYWFFGGILPNTLAAKMGDADKWEYLRTSGIVQLTSVWRPLAGDPGSIFALENTDIVQGIVMGLLILLAVGRFMRQELIVILMLFFPLALWAGYSLIGPPVVFTWYLVPGTLSLLLLSFVGAGALVPQTFLRRSRFIVTVPAIVAGLIWLQPFLADHGSRLTSKPGYIGRVVAYKDIGDWLIQHDLADTTVICTEPGYLTYRTGNRAIDAAGLVTEGIFFHGDRSRRTGLPKLVREMQPDFAVVSMPTRFPGYVPVFHSYPHKVLHANAALHEKHYEEFVNEFRSPDSVNAESPPLQHPFSLDIDHTRREEWVQMGGRLLPDAGKRPLRLNGKPFKEDVLRVRASRTGTDTPPFLIDFDRISFRFAATHPRSTLVQLLIKGRVVLERAGTALKDGEGPMRDFELESWPVGHWRGLTGRLRFVHIAGPPTEWIAGDHIHSIVSRDPVLVDDFESTGGYTDLWDSTFGDGPSNLSTFARTHGVEFDYSKGAALSVGLKGEQVMISRPFKIERNLLSLLVFDFGKAKGMGVQLIVEGEVIADFESTESCRLRPITWDVEAFRGREATIKIVDKHPSPDKWLGIDDIHMVDE